MVKIGTTYTLYGRRAGAELYFEKIIHGMIKSYPELSFIIYGNSEGLECIEDENRITKVHVPFLSSQFGKAFWLEFLAAPLVNKANLNLFWTPSGCNSFPGRWRIPNVVTFHDFGEYHVKRKYDFKRMVYRKHICVPRSIRRANAVTAVSHFTAGDLRRLFRVEVPIHVIYSGPSPRYNSDPNTNHLGVVRQETGVELSRFIFTPGRTDYIGKGLDVLLDAYAAWCRQEAQIPDLVLVGPQGEDHAAFISHINRLDLNGRIKYFGRVSDQCVSSLYSLCEFVVIPSRFEGFGFPVLEAMQHNKPVVCSDAGSLPEVTAGVALLFRSGNAADLLAKMTELFGNAALKARLLEAEAKRYSDFNWNATYEKMHEVFINTIGNKRKQSAQ